MSNYLNINHVFKVLTVILLLWQWLRLESTYMVAHSLPNTKTRHIWDSILHTNSFPGDALPPAPPSEQELAQAAHRSDSAARFVTVFRGYVSYLASGWFRFAHGKNQEEHLLDLSWKTKEVRHELDVYDEGRVETDPYQDEEDPAGLESSEGGAEGEQVSGDSLEHTEALDAIQQEMESLGEQEPAAQQEGGDHQAPTQIEDEEYKLEKLGTQNEAKATEHIIEHKGANARFLSDPKKYDRSGHVRNTYVMHNLPQVKHHCPKKKGPLPDLTGLPLYLDKNVKYEDIFVQQHNVKQLMKDEILGRYTQHSIRHGMNVTGLHKYRTCAIVGNSGNLLQSEYGEAIDRHEVVLRLNQAPAAGYEPYVGRRTTFRLLNNAWLHRYSLSLERSILNKDISRASLVNWEPDVRPVEPDKLPLERGTTFVLTRYTADEVEEMMKFWHRRKDISVSLLSSRVISLVRQMLQNYRRRLCDAGYGPYEGGTVPSSGLVGTYMLLQMCRSVTAYGFGKPGEAQGREGGAKYHYYRMWGARNVGNFEAHSFDAELALMRELLNSKREHPPENHVWWKKGVKTVGNMRMCRPNEMGMQDDNNKWCAAGITKKELQERAGRDPIYIPKRQAERPAVQKAAPTGFHWDEDPQGIQSRASFWIDRLEKQQSHQWSFIEKLD